MSAPALARQAQPEPQQADYIALLKAHDFQFEFADDVRAWRRGHYERQALRAMQERLDPNFEAWNAHAPKDQRRVQREEWRCMACGCVTAIGDTPVKRGCKCL